jgi:hypothetical protein
LLLALVASCANLIDLEERTVGDGGVAAGDPGCETYCTLAEQRCTPDAGLQLFSDKARCLAVCAKFDKGDPAAPLGNTLACRITKLKALGADQVEAPLTCPAAGPGGGAAAGEDPSSGCGSDCAGYCALRRTICDLDKDEAACLFKCAALPNPVRSFNAGADFASGQDTLQCRIAHVSAAEGYHAAGDPSWRNHCDHSGIVSSTQCDVNDKDHPEIAIRCEDFCKLNLAACGGSPVYESAQQCEAVCKKFEPANLVAPTSGNTLALGKLLDMPRQNTVRCRRTRTYEILNRADPKKPADPMLASDCGDSSLASTSCGAGKCESYCALAKAACPAQFASSDFKNELTSCESKCAAFPDFGPDKPYSVALGMTGKGLSCRVLNVQRALQPNPPQGACEAALGLPAPGTTTSLCQ